MHDPNRYDFPVTVNVYVNQVHVHQFEGFHDAQEAYLFICDTLKPNFQNVNEEEETWVIRRFDRICDYIDEHPSRQVVVAGNDRLKIGMRYTR